MSSRQQRRAQMRTAMRVETQFMTDGWEKCIGAAKQLRLATPKDWKTGDGFPRRVWREYWSASAAYVRIKAVDPSADVGRPVPPHRSGGGIERAPSAPARHGKTGALVAAATIGLLAGRAVKIVSPSPERAEALMAEARRAAGLPEGSPERPEDPENSAAATPTAGEDG